MSTRGKFTIPFSAIIGQEQLKLGLILNTINPRIGGLLIRGPKGTGKSTAVYALANLLPKRKVVVDCQYNCISDDAGYLCHDCRKKLENKKKVNLVDQKMRVITLPLSISEDRLIGSIDMAQMLTHGEKVFQPGLLATANHNFLYIDEINLLPDHIVDDILNAAATGWNGVEREGFSISHPSRFILVGTMNPEEGTIRPQLLDRMPLSVDISTLQNEDDRLEIIYQNLFSDSRSKHFQRKFGKSEKEIQKKIISARKRLHKVKIDQHQLAAIASTCIDLKVDGHRPEIIITRTALTLAAYHNHRTVERNDLLSACKLALAHRTRDGGFEPPATFEEIESSLKKSLEKQARQKKRANPFNLSETPVGQDGIGLDVIQKADSEKNPSQSGQEEGIEPSIYSPENIRFRQTKQKSKDSSAAKLDVPIVSAKKIFQALKEAFDDWKLRFSKKSTLVQNQVGRRTSTFTTESRGRPVRYKIPREFPHENLAFIPSVKNALMRQGCQFPLQLALEDLRVWIRQGKAPLTIVLIADVSGSTHLFLEPTANVISVLYRDAYRNRDKLGLVAIQDGNVRIINHPSGNLKVVLGNLTRLKPSGMTPLAEAMERALDVFKQERRRQPTFNPTTILLSDCHPEPVQAVEGDFMASPPYQRAMNAARQYSRQRIPIIVINPAHGQHRDGRLWWGTKLAMKIAALSSGKYYGIPYGRYQKKPDILQAAIEKKYIEMDSKKINEILITFRDRSADEVKPF